MWDKKGPKAHEVEVEPEIADAPKFAEAYSKDNAKIIYAAAKDKLTKAMNKDDKMRSKRRHDGA